MNDGIRNLVKETRLSKDNLIQPFFVLEGKNQKQAIPSMPGIYRYSIDLLLKELNGYQKLGGSSGILFGIPLVKDTSGSQAYSEKGIVQSSVRAIKKEFPKFFLMTDVCLCGYTNHGHCGVIEGEEVHNDKTLKLLSQTALSHVVAGSDMIAPSDMMDFRVKAIRQELDKNGFENTPILSYAAKYHSAFYGPFRDAVGSSPKFGNRKTYQMDYSNAREALKEAKQDIKEGADIVMVKPALAYLDVISLLKREVDVPIAAYSVSGEYSMIKAAAQNKWLNEKETVLESLTAMKRAGADMIISYFAKDVLTWV